MLLHKRVEAYAMRGEPPARMHDDVCYFMLLRERATMLMFHERRYAY